MAKVPRRASSPNATPEQLLRYAISHPDVAAENPALPLFALEVEKPEVQKIFSALYAKKLSRLWRALSLRTRAAVVVHLIWDKKNPLDSPEGSNKASTLRWLETCFRYNRYREPFDSSDWVEYEMQCLIRYPGLASIPRLYFLARNEDEVSYRSGYHDPAGFFRWRAMPVELLQRLEQLFIECATWTPDLEYGEEQYVRPIKEVPNE